jgi:hypothetical protein
MPRRALERIREVVRTQRYDVTKHAVDEMAEDGFDIVDLETAILNGRITKTERDDLRGVRYTIQGVAADGVTPVAARLGALQRPVDTSSSPRTRSPTNE